MVADHKHCIMCGQAVDPDKSICGPACDELMKQQQKKARRSRMMTMIIFVVMIAVIMAMSFLTAPAP